jgi:hypothetical protein
MVARRPRRPGYRSSQADFCPGLATGIKAGSTQPNKPGGVLARTITMPSFQDDNGDGKNGAVVASSPGVHGT